MEFENALRTRRSVRSYARKPIPRELLLEIADMCRFAPSAGNRQEWEIVLVDEKPMLEKVFETLAWLPSVGSPPVENRPAAYMVIISEKQSDALADCSSAATYILLAAHASGLGGCWFGSIRRTELAGLIDIPDNYAVEFVISLGYPAEKPVTFNGVDNLQVKVKEGVTSVPKRPVSDMLHLNSFGKRG